MKITHNKVGQNLNTTDLGRTEKTDKAGKAGKSGAASILDTPAGAGETASTVAVSTRAQDMKKIRDAATAGADVDDAKVAKYQKLIDSGEYKVDAESLADKMVDEHLIFS